ncbi:MAG: aminodeoxychorismate lyase [Cellvibrio sp. 79]|nr:MAG: aminodeoxychorismate lyase [Cellvibrio sp. 79]
MSALLPLISINGIPDAMISSLDRGFTYGDGVFETCRCTSGRIPLWDFHRERLINSARRLQIPLDEPRLQEYLDKLLLNLQFNQYPDTVIKIQITRGVGGRGYRLPDQVNPTYCIGIFAGNHLQSPLFLNGVDIRVCDLRLGKNPALAGIKHLNRLEHILARAEWHDEFAEGLLLDGDNNLIEATVSNVFIVKNKQLYTPDLSSSGVAGVMRRTLIEKLAPAINVLVNIESMPYESLLDADEILLTNSVFGIWPVKNVAGVSTNLHHSITRQLQQQLIQLLG